MKNKTIRRARQALWAAALSLLAGCTGIDGSEAASETTIAPLAVYEAVTEKAEVVILDVRTPAEFASGHLTGARNISVLADDAASRLLALPKEETYIVYCRSGRRSTEAVAMLRAAGFEEVLHMNEGLLGWQAANLPVERD